MKHNRRSFLKTVSAAGAGVGLLSSSFTNTVTENELMKEENKPKNFQLTILQTTDVHCQVHAHDELFWENNGIVFRKTGGYAHFASYMKKMRKSKNHLFLMDTGDMFQGSELSVKTTGRAISPILNALEYDLYLPGNWEVIYGKKEMQHLLGGLHAPKVCANMYHDLGEGKKGDHIFPPYHIWNINGVKIGFLGYTDHLVPIRQSPNYSKGILYTKPEENLAHYIDVLRNQEQCIYVIIVGHLGLSQQIHLSNLEACKGADYIFGGDTHERVRKPIQGKYAKVVEPGAFGSFCGRLELTIEEGKVIGDAYFLDEISVQKYKEDKSIKNLVNNLEGPYFEDINKIIGYSKIPLYRYFVIENTIDTMILDALRWRLPDIDVVLSNGFRFCPPRSTPDESGNIPISNGYIYDMLPVDSFIRTGKVSGKQLKVWLEKELNNVFAKDASKRFGGWVTKFQGMTVRFYAFKEEGQRVESITIKGNPISEDAIYSIAACERDGDPSDMICRIKNVMDAKNLHYTLHENMKSYLKALSPVNPVPQKNAVALDAPDTLLTQVYGVDYQFH
ncbi:MAG: 5'-nucleotidase C-terminal domain-containing protein [Saprospiraceae bacterium]|nr:5'-nucleotidase C-terminal domain-containing protein [Saprospiraceae bacterium]MBK7522630.1 5'-nucleotidase C-terminal domain-containing protein [Saprospiraceae bacterium]MBK8818180.1 5'-nucleotidase C-terminal domain-containing protein [Saprospiraceae bacterium]MBK9044896.1 5'-nucleotidase C-terminal domain-containing protein [Saprospiraceae bacterium]